MVFSRERSESGVNHFAMRVSGHLQVVVVCSEVSPPLTPRVSALSKIPRSARYLCARARHHEAFLIKASKPQRSDRQNPCEAVRYSGFTQGSAFN